MEENGVICFLLLSKPIASEDINQMNLVQISFLETVQDSGLF